MLLTEHRHVGGLDRPQPHVCLLCEFGGEELSNLYGVEGRTLAQVVTGDEHHQTVVTRWILADPSHVAGVIASRIQWGGYIQ